MKLAYVASPWGEKPAAREIRRVLLEKGVLVTSSWIERRGDPYACDGDEALQDESDLRRANLLVCYVPTPDTSRGGRDTELGMAIALGHELVLIGAERQVFHAHPRVRRYESIEQFEKEWQP